MKKQQKYLKSGLINHVGIPDIKIKTNWIMKMHYGLQSPPSVSKGKDLCHHVINRIVVMVNVLIKFMAQTMMNLLSVARLARCAIRTK